MVTSLQELFFGDPNGDHGRVISYYIEPTYIDDALLLGGSIVMRAWDRNTYETNNGSLTLEKGQSVKCSSHGTPEQHGEVYSLTDGTVAIHYQDESGQDRYELFYPGVDNIEPA